MRRQLTLFFAALVLLAFASPGRAGSACGSDTSSDPVEAMGKDVWLDGYCKSFLPCRLVLEQFHGCQAAEGFLSGLGAQQGTPLTESQVEDALVRSTGKTSGLSSCVTSFDAQACQRYLGIGSDGQASSEQAPGTAGAAAEPARKPMSRDAAALARQRIRDMDANAHTAFGMIERDCRAGGESCKSTLEQMVDPVIREADQLNANPEYLAQLPAYSPGSVEYAGRLGWTRQSGRWTFGGVKAGTTTLGNYLLSVDECRKLRDRLDQQIRATPVREPDNLPFFEAECAPQLASYADDIRSWRALLSAPAPTPNPTDQQTAGQAQEGMPVLAAPEGDLTQWNEQQLAEQRRYEAGVMAAAEERRRKAEEAQQIAASGATGSVVSSASPSESAFSKANSRYSSICMRNAAKVEEALGAAKAMRYFGGSVDLDILGMVKRMAQPCMANDPRAKAAYDDAEQARAQSTCQSGSCPRWPAEPQGAKTRQWFEIFSSEFSKMMSDWEGYSRDLDPAPVRAQSNGGAGAGALQCRAQIDDLDTRVNRYSAANPGTASGILRAVMWHDEQAIRIVESTCPNDPRYSAQLTVWRENLSRVSKTCGQIVSGGRCDSMAPD